MHIKHHVLTYVTVGKTALFSQHEPKDEVCGHSFPRTESSSPVPRVPSFSAYCGLHLPCCHGRTVISGFSLILAVPSARGKAFLGYFGGCFFFFLALFGRDTHTQSRNWTTTVKFPNQRSIPQEIKLELHEESPPFAPVLPINERQLKSVHFKHGVILPRLHNYETQKSEAKITEESFLSHNF